MLAAKVNAIEAPHARKRVSLLGVEHGQALGDRSPTSFTLNRAIYPIALDLCPHRTACDVIEVKGEEIWGKVCLRPKVKRFGGSRQVGHALVHLASARCPSFTPRASP